MKTTKTDAQIMASHSLNDIAAGLTATIQSWGCYQVPANSLRDFVQALHIKDAELKALLDVSEAAKKMIAYDMPEKTLREALDNLDAIQREMN